MGWSGVGIFPAPDRYLFRPLWRAQVTPTGFGTSSGWPYYKQDIPNGISEGDPDEQLARAVHELKGRVQRN